METQKLIDLLKSHSIETRDYSDDKISVLSESWDRATESKHMEWWLIPATTRAIRDFLGY